MLSGGDGDDWLYIDADDILVDGGDGFDTARLQGEKGVILDLAATRVERVYGWVGNDTLTAATMARNVEINGGDGNDLIVGGAHADTLGGDNGNDSLIGGAGNDTLIGGGGADVLSGGDGDDWLYIDADDILVDGGDGFDTARLQGDVGVTLDLAATSIERVYGWVGNDTLTAATMARDVEINGGDGNDLIVGGAYADTLRGDDGNDSLTGGAGNDTLIGGGGADVLFADGGADMLWGGDGMDLFAFSIAASGSVVMDFQVGVDRLTLLDGTSDLAAVIGSARVEGGSTILDLGSGNCITILGQTGSVADWFA